MNLTKTIIMSNEISQQLFLCTSENKVDEVFNSFKINKILDKIGLLQLCMGVKNFSSSPSSNNLTLEQQYHDILLVFLEGSWRFLV